MEVFYDEVYTKSGFQYHVELSKRPENSIGNDEDWDVATKALEGAFQSMGLPYVVNEGDGALLGQKEQEEHGVSVRKHDEGDLGVMSLEEFISSVRS